MKKRSMIPQITLLSASLVFTGLSPVALAHDTEDGSPHPEVSVSTESTKQAEELRKETAKKERELRREAEKQRTEQVKAKEKKLKEAAKTAREQEKEQLAAVIKDERRLNRAQKAAATIDKVHDQLTTNASRRLVRFEDSLTKINTIVARLEADGRDVTVAKAAIETAMAGLLEAKAALTILEANEYQVAVTEEMRAGEAFTTVLHTMRDDHKALHKLIKTTHEKVRTALKTVKAVAKPSPSPSVTSEVE